MKADAFEAFDHILSLIHCWISAFELNTASKENDNLLIGTDSNLISKYKEMKCNFSGDQCFVHKMFFVKHIFQEVCECGKKSGI